VSADIEHRQDAALSLPATPSDRQQWANDLMAWASAADAAHGVATLLAETSFVPKSMQHRPGDVTGAILTGIELGVPIMWALSHIDIVEGAPAIRAKGLRALMLRHGHDIWVEESSATRAIVCARRSGSQRVERSVWTLDRAKHAELLGKKNWRLYPTDMLINRATAEAVRLAAPDVLLGHYTVEELGGDEMPDGTAPSAAERAVQKPAPAKRRTAQRAKPEPGPAPEELPTDMPSPPAGKADHLGGELPGTCDLMMPHDTRHSPHGCPPNCPTRVAAELSAAEGAVGGAQAVAMFADVGLQPEVLIETADVIDTMDEPAEPEPMVTDGQRKRMAVEMRNAGIVDRDERLTYVSDLIGRRVESGNELTVAEASRVIQSLIDKAIKEGLAAVKPTEGDQ
jgi:hypothetical protein